MLRAVLSAVTAPPRAPATEPAEAPVPRFRRGRESARQVLRSINWWHAAPILVALLFAIVYLIWQPRTVDLAAHTFRAELFGEEGFTIWNGQWYGGHHTPAYSIISPPLAWLLEPAGRAGVRRGRLRRPLPAARARPLRRGARPLGLDLVRRRHRARCCSRAGCRSRSASPSGSLRCSRCSATATRLAIVLAVLCPLGSPVAGLFLAMAGVAYAIAERRNRVNRLEGLAIAAAAFIPPVFLAWAFPEGGWAPFPTSAYVPIPLFALAVPDRAATRGGGAALGRRALRPRAPRSRWRSRRRWAATPCASARCSAARCCLCALWGRRFPHRLVVLPLLAVGFASLAFWQWSPAVRDVIKYIEDPAAKSDYFEPLRQFLFTLPDQRRIEIPFTRSHWEGAEVAMEQPLARGWLRQLDTGLHPIFYREGINRLTYASWLADNASATSRCRARSPTRARTASAR